MSRVRFVPISEDQVLQQMYCIANAKSILQEFELSPNSQQTITWDQALASRAALHPPNEARSAHILHIAESWHTAVAWLVAWYASGLGYWASVAMAPQNSMVAAATSVMIMGGFLNGVDPSFRSLSPFMKHVIGEHHFLFFSSCICWRTRCGAYMQIIHLYSRWDNGGDDSLRGEDSLRTLK